MKAAILIGAALVTFASSFLIGRRLSGWPLRLSLEYAGTMTVFLTAIAGVGMWLTLAVAA